MATPDRPGTCATCGDPIVKRRIRDSTTLDGPTNGPEYHYTCGTCLHPVLLEDDTSEAEQE